MNKYEPDGTRFFDAAFGREMVLVKEGHAKGWLCYRHPDGQWVTLREATAADRAALHEAATTEDRDAG